MAQNSSPGLEEAYQQAARDAGHQPGACIIPPDDMPNIVFVHPDPDQGWEEIGEYMLADARSYSEWSNEAGLQATVVSNSKTVADLRDEQGPYRVVTAAGAVELINTWGSLPLHPLCGGIPAELAWKYLRRVADEVVPAMASVTS
ncbi:hypothetical protein [Oceanicoccus sp. KOV_DT_Chl]|uniref:hypothetical protein n=1 Tax=Oceanicoccus sp. KOV_DT_Chl TaxID=1904639 RepID=UPI00190ED4D5|nr:hypothetical protein [Oceanicoccus sp. KOV_DT_Chl]